MSVKITMTYDDGTEKGKQVITTEIWEGNVLPLAKITKVLEGANTLGGKLQKTKVVKAYS